MFTTLPAAPAITAVAAPSLEATAVRGALAQLLASEGFCKAQRMSRLVRFLVEKRLDGAVRDTAEYAIGIEVFDRDPSNYSTGEDPIVRVQIGRLRDKLRLYYASSGQQAAVRFFIPIGSYMPEITFMPKLPPPLAQNYLLAIAPLACLSGGVDLGAATFTHGLNEELAHRLYRSFGQTIVSHTVEGGATGVSHRLEGSLRVEGELIRASLRLVDHHAGCIVWSEQFDHGMPFTIALQEQLARAICDGLERYFALG